MYMNINIEHYMLFYVDILNCMINDHNCTQICVEVEGSFNCSCFPGYELEEDEITCTGSHHKIRKSLEVYQIHCLNIRTLH